MWVIQWGANAWEVIVTKQTPEAGWMKEYAANELGEEETVTQNDGFVTVVNGELTINWRAY